MYSLALTLDFKHLNDLFGEVEIIKSFLWKIEVFENRLLSIK